MNQTTSTRPNGKVEAADALHHGYYSHDATAEVIRRNRGILLDVGCGSGKHPGSVGMDAQSLEGVDIVHSWNDFPWPIPDESVLTVLARHVVEHVSPVDGHFIRWLDECWRILKPGRQLAMVMPYGTSSLFAQDPTHCNPCNETTWLYFDPEHESQFYRFYQPAPWAIEVNTFHSEGVMETVLRKREDKPEYHMDEKLHYTKGGRIEPYPRNERERILELELRMARLEERL